jgi:hypothetical protein
MLELASDNGSVHSQTVMEWFALPVSGTATREELDRRLNAERDSGDK